MTGRPAETSRTLCTRCGELLRAGDRFCPSCGSSVIGCEQCGATLSALDRFCPRCGTSVGSALPSAVVPPQPAAPAPEENPWVQVVSRLRGATAGEFEILRELGRGGMAAVYLAHETALNRKVALKVMSPALLTGAGMVSRFRQEAITVANMSHPHIITIHAVRQVADLHFFVMKFVEGRSLEHIVRSSGPLPVATVRGLLWMVGNALAYAHRRGVVHRDVKPANILVDDEGNAIVTDFGIAKLMLGDSGVPRTSQGGQTQTGIIIGTPTYMSPEQCLARPVSAASDQYSLGLVAYELLTGRPPFTGSPFVVMHAHTERPAPSVRELRPECDVEFDEALMRMLAKEPAQRWPSVQHALAALRAAPLADDDPARIELARLSIPQPFRRSDEVLQSTPSPRPAVAAGAPPADPRPYVAVVEIFAPPPVVEVGDTFTLRGSPRNPSGDTMPGVRVRWSSSNDRVATIEEWGGVVHAVAVGEVELSGTAGGVRNFVKLSIVPARVAAINLSLPPGALHVGDRVQLVAMPEDKHHEGISTTVHWSSADESIAVVGEDGVVSAKAPGQVLVWAESQGVRGVARIEVTPAPVAALRVDTDLDLLEVGESCELIATTLDAAGEPLSNRVVRWRSTDVAVAEVINDRVVYARGAGVATLTCVSEGRSASLTLTVVEPEVASIVITPPPAHVDLGLPLTLHAEVTSARGVRITRPLAWRSDTPRTASVNADGVVLPLAPGAATIVASIDDREERVDFEVNPAPELIVPTATLSATAVLELREVRRMLGQLDDDLDAAAPTDEESGAASIGDVGSAAESEPIADPEMGDAATAHESESADVAADEEYAAAETFASLDSDTESQPSEELEPFDEAQPVSADELRPVPSIEEEQDDAGVDDAFAEPVAAGVTESVSEYGADWTPASEPSFLERFTRRRGAVIAGTATVLIAAAAWALWPTGPDRGRELTSSGALASADSAAASPQGTTAPDTTTAVAADTTTVAPVAAAKDSIAVSVPRPIRVGDSTVLRGKTFGDTTGRGKAIVWTSSAPAVLRVNARTGRIVGVSEGTATLTGRWGSATTTVPVRVIAAAPATAPGRSGPQPVAELIATDIKGALHEGDTVRVTAAALDGSGHSILSRRATWRSEQPDIASVDPWGLVTAHRIGKTELVATLDQHAVRVAVVVSPRPIASTQVEAALRGRVDDFLLALTEHDAARLTALYSVATPQDQKNLDWLLDKVQRPDANLRLSRAQYRKPAIGDSEAALEVALRLTWTVNGRNRDTNATFRARFTRSGDGWEPAGIRAARNLE